jgi:S-DNA-T family DNA segregation ATPase FtsK/SpoIIIE
MIHRGGERAMGRVVFAVIAVAFAAVHCATLVPGDAWSHTFGLGGLFGDTVLGSLIGVMPGSAGFGLKVLSLLTFGGLVAFLLFVTGFNAWKLKAGIQRFLTIGAVHGYDSLRRALGMGGRGAMRGALALRDRARSQSAPATDTSALRRVMPPVTGGERGHMQPEPLRANPRAMSPAPAAGLRAPVPTEPAAPAYGRDAEPQRDPARETLREKIGFLARLRRKPRPGARAGAGTRTDRAGARQLLGSIDAAG